MGKNKLKRWAEMADFPNVFELDPQHKGRWCPDFFNNNNPLVLELGCGRGEYTVGLARNYPDQNFIGVDIKGARLWRGAKTCLEEGIRNAAFLRIAIEDLEAYFDPKELSGIWITFPDPQPQKSRAKKRLTGPRFLEMYRRLLKAGAPVHLKTDNTQLFAWTLEVLDQQKAKVEWATPDLYGDKGPQYSNPLTPLWGSGSGSPRIRTDLPQEAIYPPLLKSITTHYEQMFRAEGETIKYIRFYLDL